MNDDSKVSEKIRRIKELIAKGNEFLRQENYDEALSTFDKVLAEEPRFFDALIGKIKVYLELFQWQNVIIFCDKILEINPKEITAIEHKIWALYALDNVDEALKFAKQAQKDYPDNEKIQRCIDECLKKKQIEDTDKTYKRRIKEKPIFEREIPKEAEEIRPLPDTSEMKKTNKFLIGIVYAYLMAVIVIFLIIDLTFFIKLHYKSRLFIQIGLYSCLLVSFLILVYFDKHTNLRELGISTQNLTNSILIGLFVSSGFVVTALIFWIAPITEDFITILIIGLLTILIGIVEEFFFRGYLESKARKTTRKMIAILITGIFFAVLHVPKYLIIPFTTTNIPIFASIPATVQTLIILGLLFGFIRENTKNIIGPIIAHTTWDFYLLIYTPTNFFQLYTIPRPLYFSLFQSVASLAMLGTFLLAWAISSKLKVNILEDPREFVMEIEELKSKAEKTRKKILKLQYKITYLNRRQNYYIQSNYYAYRSLEFKKRKLERKIDSLNAQRDLLLEIAEKIKLENYTELMDYKDGKLKTIESDLKFSTKEAVKTSITKPEIPERLRINQFGYNIIPINSRIRELEQKKASIQTKIELYSLKQESLQNKNPRQVRQLGLKIEKLRIQVEYYDRLINIYNDVAETISHNNAGEKRRFINVQKRMAKQELKDKMRRSNLNYYRRSY